MTRRHAKVLISAREAGQKLDEWLAARFTYHSMEAWRQLIEEGRVLRNDVIAGLHTVLVESDEIEYRFPEIVEPAVNPDFTILHEDDEVLAINKPADLPCHPAGKFFKNTLWYLLRQDYPEARLINRLDRETSGVSLVAKHKRVARQLGKMFARRDVKKEYLVLVEGQFPVSLHAEGVLFQDSDSEVRKKRAFAYEGEGESCLTDFTLLSHSNGASLVHAVLGTGRLHQIRATLCSLGYPVVGDKIYGVDDRLFIRFVNKELTVADHKALRLSHQALHAWKLTVTIDDQEHVFQADLPKDTQQLMQELRLELP